MSVFDPAALLRVLVRSSLTGASGLYSRRDDGSLVYWGSRPGPEWEGHGYFRVVSWMLDRGALVRQLIWKHRWRSRETGATCHSRPPDDLSVGACSVIVVLCLWSFDHQFKEELCNLQNWPDAAMQQEN